MGSKEVKYIEGESRTVVAGVGVGGNGERLAPGYGVAVV